MLALTEGGQWLLDARRLPSPNADARPPGLPIDLIVVHGISLPAGEFGGPYIDALFSNTLPQDDARFAAERVLRVSAHVLIRRDGALVQYVPFGARAWHAGESSWLGRARCNDYSIGIELEGTDRLPYEDVQYRQLARLARTLMQQHPAITLDRIVGHADVAPGRKTDPGPAFEWSRLRALLS